MSAIRRVVGGSNVGTGRRLAAVAAAAAMLVGGCGPPAPPDPFSAGAVEARARQVARMSRALDDLVVAYHGHVLGESSIDACYQGQRNWKVDTGYDHRCSLLLGVLIGIDGHFRSRLLDGDAALKELGWQSGNQEWPGLLVDGYWETRAGENADGRVRVDRLPGPLMVTQEGLRLLFDYGSTVDDRGLARIDRGQQSTPWCCGLPFYEDRRPMDVDQVTEGQRFEHLILITVEGHYLQT